MLMPKLDDSQRRLRPQVRGQAPFDENHLVLHCVNSILQMGCQGGSDKPLCNNVAHRSRGWQSR
jgi:hypothetical protein